MDEEEINMCIDEFKKYIGLVIIKHYEEKGYHKNNQSFVSRSSEIIDEVLHNLILFTTWYYKVNKTIKNTSRKNMFNNTLHNNSENRETISILNKA